MGVGREVYELATARPGPLGRRHVRGEPLPQPARYYNKKKSINILTREEGQLTGE